MITLRRLIVLLALSIGIIGGNSLVLSPIASQVADSFSGVSPAQVLYASSGYGLATALSALSLAPQADRIGLVRALTFALGLLTVAFALSAIAPTLTVLIVAQMLCGVAAGMALPSVYGLTAEIAPEGQESAILGKVLTGWTLALVFGVTFSAVLTDLLNWRAVFAGLCLISLIITLSVRAASAGFPPKSETQNAPSPIKALRVPGLKPVLIIVALFMTAFYGLYAFVGTHLTVTLGTSTTFAGLAALFYGIGFAAVAPLDRMIDHYGSRRVAPLVFTILSVIYAAFTLVDHMAWALVLFAALWGAANHVGLNLIVSTLSRLDKSQRASIMGLYSAVAYLAMFAGTAVYGFVFTIYGFGATALISSAAIVPAIAHSLRDRQKTSA